MPLLYLSAGWDTSSLRTRDGRPRAADTRDAGFHTLLTVAAQQSRSKSCGLYCMGRAPGASLQEDTDCGGAAAAHYWSGHAQTSVSSTRQRSSGVSASVLVSLQTADILNICCECCTAFAVNAEFYCHINRCSALK